jgi:hypothetical protein
MQLKFKIDFCSSSHYHTFLTIVISCPTLLKVSISKYQTTRNYLAVTSCTREVRVSNVVRNTDMLTENLRDFSQCLETNAGIVFQLYS